MMQIVLVGLGAGLAAALLFASVASGSHLAMLLFCLAPLPIVIAALGWSHLAGLVAGFAAALSLGLVLGFYFFIVFMVAVALPAWWLAYLAQLARPVGGNGAMMLEWYPVGRLVVWAALLAAVLVILLVPALGTDKASFQAGLRSVLESALRMQTQMAPDDAVPADTERLINILVVAFPPGLAALVTVISVVNLWLAGHIVRLSDRLNRPWPDLSTLTLPPLTPGLLALAMAGVFLPDLGGVVSTIVAASLLMAYALLGFAVLHAITRGADYRGAALAGAYAAVVLLGRPVLAASLLGLALLGLADAAFNIRTRVAAGRVPPNPRT